VLRHPPAATPAIVAPAAVAVTLVSLAPTAAAATPDPPARPEEPPPAEPETPAGKADPGDAPPEAAPQPQPSAEPPSPPASPDTPQLLTATAPGGCAVPSEVQAALQDATVRAALHRIPSARRSVANAVMLWDGQWIAAGALADAATAAPIRQAIAAAVRRADPGCAAAPIRGPMFFVVPDEAGAMVLVMGAAQWRWSDLADPAES
jgi:hypothetical protein